MVLMKPWPFESDLAQIFLSFCERVPFGIILTDRALQIVHLNGWVREHLAEKDREWEGAPLLHLLDASAEEYVLPRFQDTLQNGTPQTLSTRFHPVVFRLLSQSGAPLPHSVTLLPPLRPRCRQRRADSHSGCQRTPAQRTRPQA